MEWTLPGTVLRIRREDADGVEELFSSCGMTRMR